MFAASVEASDSGGVPKRGRRNLTVLAVASIILLVLVLFALGSLGGPPTSSNSPASTTSSTSYNVEASSVLSSASNDAPYGYSQGSTKPLNPRENGLTSAGYALYSNQGGALANVTILVFNSTVSAQTYVTSVIANAKAVSGYSDSTSSLSSFEHYGTCYGYAESDPEGGQYVANGVCTKGNVYIQVHVATTSSLTSAESDASGFVGATYRP